MFPRRNFSDYSANKLALCNRVDLKRKKITNGYDDKVLVRIGRHSHNRRCNDGNQWQPSSQEGRRLANDALQE